MANDVRYSISLDDKFSGKLKTADKAASSFEQKIMKVGKAVGGVFAAGAILNLGTKVAKGVVETTAEFEKFEAVLSNTLGSNSAAQKALQQISDFAARTPFQVSELSSSFVKLANQGFKPTVNEMTSLGDLASSTGKGFDQLTEAIIDAQVGEFERLKEFGIRASKQGDKVSFTFKGVKKQVDFTEQSIRDYVLSLGNAAGVSGAMAKISKTTGGQISNLKDSIDQANLALGRRFNKSTERTISLTSKVVKGFTSWVDVKLSESIKDEQEEVFRLAAALQNSQTPQDERIAAYNRLKEIQPDILKGISQENIDTGKLSENLKKYNAEAVNRILLAQLDEREQKLLAKQARNTARSVNKQTDAISEFSKILAMDASPALNQLTEDALVKLRSGVALTEGEFNKFLTAIEGLDDERALENLVAEAANANIKFSLWNKNLERVKDNSEDELENLEDRRKILKDILGIQTDSIRKQEMADGVVSAVPSTELSDGIQTIKSAAPKTFNININNLVEEFNVNSQTVSEGAVAARETVIEALTRAVADVQARA